MAKNLHMTHAEDYIITEGSLGGKHVIQLLRYMGEFLSGNPTRANVTVKFDGSPAVVCGIDPSDNKFFVGTKSVFAKNDPKICKTESDIFSNYSGALANKLLACLKFLPACNIRGVLQGDLLFTDDKKRETIDGKRFITFRPNTITYAAPDGTDLGRSVDKAQLGITFHTKYIGTDLPSMNAVFNIDDSDFRSTSNVWAQKAEFKDITRSASMTNQERIIYDRAVNRAEGSLKQCGNILNTIQSGKKPLQIDTEFIKFFNRYVIAGNNIPSVDQAYVKFFHHMGGEYGKVIEKNVQLKTQAEKAGKFIDVVEFLEQNKREIKMLIASYMNIQLAKNILVKKMNNVGGLHLFVKQGQDYKVTSPEGYVAIVGERATKLIDRLTFSNLNFNVEKLW